jgi:hypothetical protein
MAVSSLKGPRERVFFGMVWVPEVLEPYVVPAVVLVAAAGIAFAFPGFRRSMRDLREEWRGRFNGRSLSNRPSVTAKDTVLGRVRALVQATDRELLRTMAEYHDHAHAQALSYGDARQSVSDRADELRRAEKEELALIEAGEIAPPQRMPIPHAVYWALQTALGIGDAVFTYFALELYPLPPIALFPLVLLLGGAGAMLGHFLGQAIVHREREKSIAVGIFSVFYCIILGTARFGYVLYESQEKHGAAGRVDIINIVFAFGIPLLLVFLSTVCASQLRLRTPVEIARSNAAAAQHTLESTYQRGAAAADAVNARMNEHKKRTDELISAYRHGFRIGWRNEPLVFDESAFEQVTIPPAAIWPPAVMMTNPAAAGDGAPRADAGSAPGVAQGQTR